MCSEQNYLRCIFSEYPKQWSTWISLAELWYNTNLHTSLQKTPFEVLCGYGSNHMPLGTFHDTVVPSAATTIHDRLQILVAMKENLAKVHNRMKHYANQHRFKSKFSVVEWVFLKLQPYNQ